MPLKRYFNKITNAVGGVIGNAMSYRKEQEAKGYNNMADLIRYARESKGRIPDTDWRDPEFRKAIMAIHAKEDFMSKDRAKRARRYYTGNFFNR